MSRTCAIMLACHEAFTHDHHETLRLTASGRCGLMSPCRSVNHVATVIVEATSVCAGRSAPGSTLRCASTGWLEPGMPRITSIISTTIPATIARRISFACPAMSTPRYTAARDGSSTGIVRHASMKPAYPRRSSVAFSASTLRLSTVCSGQRASRCEGSVNPYAQRWTSSASWRSTTAAGKPAPSRARSALAGKSSRACSEFTVARSTDQGDLAAPKTEYGKTWRPILLAYLDRVEPSR